MLVAEKIKQYNAEAEYVGESVDLKRAQHMLKRYQVLEREGPMIVEYTAHHYVAIAKFGVVVWWGLTENQKSRFLADLMPCVRAKKQQYEFNEELRVIEDKQGFEQITQKGVHVLSLDLARIKIISFALAQSVALDRYEHDIEENLGRAEYIIAALKESGYVRLRERQILKQVGSVLAVKQTAISHLSLFDNPEETWESPDLERLYGMLKAELDLSPRFSILDKKIQFLSENSKMLMDFHMSRQNALLEIIIILLIFIEVAPLLLGFIRRLLGI